MDSFPKRWLPLFRMGNHVDTLVTFALNATVRYIDILSKTGLGTIIIFSDSLYYLINSAIINR